MEPESLTVVVERITYQNPQNGYSVLRASSRGHPGGVTLVGNFGPVHAGEELRAYGVWTQHPQFGPQFNAYRYSVLKPATLKGIEKYLGSGLIKGIGPVTARRLVKEFGVESLDIIEHHPDRLQSCEGIGPGRAEKIVSGWREQKIIQDVMVFLQSHGVSTAYAVRIFKNYGNRAIDVVAKNPYILAQEVRGIGFKTADKIAAEFDIKGADPRRLEAGTQYILLSALDEGHLYLHAKQIQGKSKEILGLECEEFIPNILVTMTEQKKLTMVEENGERLFYLPFAFRAEMGCAERVLRMVQTKPSASRSNLLAILERAVSLCGKELSDVQQSAVENSLQNHLFILTGGPGTGKTTTLQAVVEAHKQAGRRVMLASPTGRAAKRLAEVTGQGALTIHRLLSFSPQDNAFKHNQENPLPCDTLIIDEASMIDIDLFHAVLKSLAPGTTLILVGDVDQLPSVGPGLVLKHLIDSQMVPMVRLSTIFRQAESSLIITNAHRINHGTMPTLMKPDGKTQTDCYFLEAPEPENALALLKNVVAKSLPGRFKYHPLQDIQVLSPMNRGSLGCGNLNLLLQETLNPPAEGRAELKHQHNTFRVGDKVIQTRNNYDLEVFNGDIGIISAVEPEDQELIVDYPQGPVTYQNADLLDLAHAFAVSIHKSQGSEYPAVVLIFGMQHYVMLKRNLLYTGVTRAKKTLVIIGSRKALGMAVRDKTFQERNSRLCRLLTLTKNPSAIAPTPEAGK
jgi:exodeoxyribonuclease V alpha subunit